MKCAVLRQAGQVAIEERPIPRAEGDGVLIKVEYCGICGTDILIYRGIFHANFPYSPGHEYSGVVIGTGDKVSRIHIGDRVAVDPNHECGSCVYCRTGRPNHCENLKKPGIKSNGGFAEYCRVPEKIVHRIPDSISFSDATFIEPVSCVLHMLDEAGIRAGDLVVIVGGGTMGLTSLLLCRHYGARAIILSEPVEYKREMALSLGADMVCDPMNESLSVMVKQLDLYGADVVLDHVGTAGTIAEAVRCLKKNGKLILSGLNSDKPDIPVSAQEIVKNELMIKGAFLNPYTFTRSIELMGKIRFPWERLVTHEFALSDISRAFEVSMQGKAVKVLVRVNQDESG